MREPSARERAIDDLLDRREIADCVQRYARGVDRLDAELILSAYHDDAFDDHGAFRGSPQEFVDWYIPYAKASFSVHHHYVLNHTCEVDGDVAHCETYYLFAGQGTGEDSAPSLHGGRYVDRFERRAGVWAIAARINLAEWSGGLALLPSPPGVREEPGRSARDRSDSSYDRPLLTRAERDAPGRSDA